MDRLFLYKGGRRDDITVVFDGPSSRSYWARGGIKVQFAPIADEEVIAQAGPGKLVVSSDIEVQSGARRRGAKVQGSDEFWQLIKTNISRRRYRSNSERPRPAFSGTWDKADWDEDDDYGHKPSKRKGRKRRR